MIPGAMMAQALAEAKAESLLTPEIKAQVEALAEECFAFVEAEKRAYQSVLAGNAIEQACLADFFQDGNDMRAFYMWRQGKKDAAQ